MVLQNSKLEPVQMDDFFQNFGMCLATDHTRVLGPTSKSYQSEAHVLTDGLAGAENRMIGIVALHQKSVRERRFPVELLEKGLKVKIEETWRNRTVCCFFFNGKWGIGHNPAYKPCPSIDESPPKKYSSSYLDENMLSCRVWIQNETCN
jgi:hypothetical protein